MVSKNEYLINYRNSDVCLLRQTMVVVFGVELLYSGPSIQSILTHETVLYFIGKIPMSGGSPCCQSYKLQNCDSDGDNEILGPSIHGF